MPANRSKSQKIIYSLLVTALSILVLMTTFVLLFDSELFVDGFGIIIATSLIVAQ